ncbi:hypothetical protein ambt_03175 [Alteromonas naphthalenivorans]|uniref:Uncharacterized protein n=1 Tax=Alteromonas naphthalenivorans TaxID=715451 RepID=F5ZAQ7_ALTNA|nr:hypothetical protein ambt_03175 [Alteromonas naphthalenivorans]
MSVSPQQQFKVAFDVAKGADVGKVNRKFDSLARFIKAMFGLTVVESKRACFR